MGANSDVSHGAAECEQRWTLHHDVDRPILTLSRLDHPTEPNPILAETYLPQNLALNGFHHGVEVCPKVVSNMDDQTANFVLHANDFATSSMEPWAYSHRSDTIPIPTVTIDRLCADWPRLDLVKIDAEGAESLVWEGMRDTRKRLPGAVIVLEMHVPRDPADASTLLDGIQAEGYALHTIQFDGTLVQTSASDVVNRPHAHWTLWLE